MKLNTFILLVILLQVLFSCGSGSKSEDPGNQNADISDSDNQEEPLDQDCINGTYRCNGNIVQKCDEEKWQNVQKCADDRVCKAETGKCDLKSNEIDDNDDSDKDNLPDENNDKDSECTEEGDFKCHSPFVSYICQDGYWKHYEECPEDETCNDKSGQCSLEIGQTRNVDCTNLPENAEWNSVSSITQTWNGTEWLPSNKGTFNEESASNECRFKCKTQYEWKNFKCESIYICTPGEIHQCYNGPSGTEGVGICKAGTAICLDDGRGWGECYNQILPQNEIYNDGIDQDCDGADVTPESAKDHDGDGILDYHECPEEPCKDSDGDGTPDFLDLDSDNDGLSDKEEKLHGTDPCNKDTDGDGDSDWEEITYGSNPLDETSNIH